MLTQVEASKCSGKTVLEITLLRSYSGMIITFTDGTYCGFRVEHEFEDDYIDEMFNTIDDFGFANVHAGVMDNEEFTSYISMREKLRDEAELELKKQHFERLKVELGY